MIIYRAWLDSDIIGEWDKPEKARKDLLEWIENNEGDAKVLHFGAFEIGLLLKPLYSYFGAEQIKEFFDVDEPVE